ncbi:Hypothetical protein R9X50_00014700 [Acrodontium crateriforme]|uniref:F-box domain-containing protein n=1 Tax=Acrodontium crateriforme TaxID=150365 RepID=A0AAQ3R8Z2_9PEZI|nr:Hypothetical protein R9X50_00014700 [Acrodontium crateriforme]
MKILELPEEILDLCCCFADKPTLCALRQTAHQWLPSATKRLFEHLDLRPTEESAARCQSILESRLNFAVSSVTFTTSDRDIVDNRDHVLYPDEAILLDESRDFLLELGRFQNLQAVSLRFAMDCAAPKRGRSYMVRQIRETWKFRESVIDCLIAAFGHQDHPAKKLRRLSIKNLQNFSKEATVTSPIFKSVLQQLDSLALQIATEYDNSSPEVNISLEEVHKFFNYDLKNHWLRPASSHLVDLKLYAAELEWGYFPACDLRDLHFPKLRSLALGLMTFSHDWQLDWILSQAETLETLILDDCPIVQACYMLVTFACDRSPPDRHAYKLARGEDSWEYGARWYEYFQRIRRGLPKLKRFGFGRGPWDEHQAFQNSAELGASLYRQRYCIFDGSIAPKAWVTDVAEVKGKRVYGCAWDKAPPYPDCDHEDQEALDALLNTIMERR